MLGYILTIGIITLIAFLIYKEAKRRKSLPPPPPNVEKMW